MRSVTGTTSASVSRAPAGHPLARLLLSRVDQLADEITGRVLDGVPSAGPAAEEVRRSCRHGLRTGLRQMAGGLGDEVDRFAPTRELARQHARRGLPVEAALRAQRISGEVVWHALFDGARGAGGVVDLDAVLAAASDVWVDVDRHATVFVTEFHRELRRLASSGTAQVQAVLAELVSGHRSDDESWLRHAAALLGVEVGGRALVVVALPWGRPGAVLDDAEQQDAGRSLAAPQEALAARGLTSTWTTVDDLQVGLVPVPGDPRAVPDLVRSALAPLARGRGGLSPVVSGLVHVAQARRWAETAARSLPWDARQVVPLEHCLPEALVVRSPDVADLLVERAVGGLLVLPQPDREALMSTLGALVAADWSPTRAAAALFCHRNTVLYRQQRIEQATGQDLSRPRTRLLLTLALMALDRGTVDQTGPARHPVEDRASQASRLR